MATDTNLSMIEQAQGATRKPAVATSKPRPGGLSGQHREWFAAYLFLLPDAAGRTTTTVHGAYVARWRLTDPTSPLCSGP